MLGLGPNLNPNPNIQISMRKYIDTSLTKNHVTNYDVNIMIKSKGLNGHSVVCCCIALFRHFTLITISFCGRQNHLITTKQICIR